MKSVFKVAITALFLGGFAQGSMAQAFFGISGGLNMAGLTMGEWKPSTDPLDKKPEFESIRRLSFAVQCELPLSRYFYFQPELAWTTKGGIISVDSGYSDIQGGGTVLYQTVNNLDLHYLQLPLLMKWRLQLTNPQPLFPNEGTGKPLFFELYAGPVVNFLLLPRANYSQTVEEYSINGDSNIYKQVFTGGTQSGLKRLDFSVAIGGTFKWKVSRKTFLSLDARYSLNFLNINNGALVNTYTNESGNEVRSIPSLKNSGNLCFSLGISHTFTKRRYWNHPRMKKRRF